VTSVITVSDAKDAEKKETRQREITVGPSDPLSIKDSMGRPIGIMSAPERLPRMGSLTSSLSQWIAGEDVLEFVGWRPTGRRVSPRLTSPSHGDRPVTDVGASAPIAA